MVEAFSRRWSASWISVTTSFWRKGAKAKKGETLRAGLDTSSRNGMVLIPATNASRARSALWAARQLQNSPDLLREA